MHVAHPSPYTARSLPGIRTKPVGRIYQHHAPASPDQAWFWSITVYVEPRSALRTSGTASTLDEAKFAFKSSSESWRGATRV